MVPILLLQIIRLHLLEMTAVSYRRKKILIHIGGLTTQKLIEGIARLPELLRREVLKDIN